MMETKLWLCALLIIHAGSAEHDGEHGALDAAPAQSDDRTEASVSGFTENPNVNGSATTPNGTNGLTNNASTEQSAHASNESPSELPVITADSHSSPSHPPAIISTTDVAHTSSVDVPNIPSPTPDYGASHDTPPLADSTMNLGNPTGNPSPTASPTSAPAPETSITTSSPPSTSTSGAICPLEHSSSNTSSSPYDLYPKVTGETTSWTNNTLSSSPSPMTKTHGDNPSELNVGEEPIVHDPPMLDPLLAGLLSAFIVTAVILTLLLFLKLRRRDDRPEFSRLQDLPMDDMMEDSSLTMYSY